MERKIHFLLACALIWSTTISDASAQLKFKDWQIVPAGRRKVVPAEQPPQATATSEQLKLATEPQLPPKPVIATTPKRSSATAVGQKSTQTMPVRRDKISPVSHQGQANNQHLERSSRPTNESTQNPIAVAAPTGTQAQVSQVNHRKILQTAHRGAAATSMSGVDSSLPIMPLLPRRDFETDEEPIRVERRLNDRFPSSRFVDSLEGTTAAIELVVSQGRLFRTKSSIVNTVGVSVVAIGDPTVVDFDLLPDSKTLRLRGMRVGVTDMTFVTVDGTAYSFEIHVLYDLPLVESHLRQVFPTAHIELKQLREHVIVEGEARSVQQVTQIIDVLTAYLNSLQVTQSQRGSRVSGGAVPTGDGRGGDGEESDEPLAPDDPEAGDVVPGEEGEGGEGEGEGDADGPRPQGIPTEVGGRARSRSRSEAPQIINLLKVPQNQQVLLKVQIAELDRRAIREIGVDLTLGGGAGDFFQSVLTGTGNLFASFPDTELDILMQALRQNSVATVLAEPNLVTLSGHTATFQSGGEFGFIVGQGFGAFAAQFKPFGVLLAFTPYVLDDGTIRLQVAPEVSNVDQTLGIDIPGVRTRNASTTVNLREGQTLAIAGLLQLDRAGTTTRVPLVGDIPVVGNLFSDNQYDVREQELLVIVTPYLVDAIENADSIPLPGEEIMEPNDLEFYLINRIEGRTCSPHRSTMGWDQPLDGLFQMRVEQSYTAGPVGLSR